MDTRTPASPRSRPWVEASIHLPHGRRRQVRVDLRRRDVDVAEHDLDRAEVGAALEQVARERVPEHVGRDAVAEAGSVRGLPHDRPQGLPREAPAAGVHEQSATVACARIRRTDLPEVAPHPLHGFPADGDETLLPPLSVADHITY